MFLHDFPFGIVGVPRVADLLEGALGILGRFIALVHRTGGGPVSGLNGSTGYQGPLGQYLMDHFQKTHQIVEI